MTVLINLVKNLNNTTDTESNFNYSKYSFDMSFTRSLLEFFTSNNTGG